MNEAQKNYRDGLAEDLIDFRSRKPEGMEDAKTFLNLARETTRYKVAKAAHTATGKKQAPQPPTGVDEKLTIPSVERAYEAILQDSRVFVLINGTGNILNKQGVATKGQNTAVFDVRSKKLVEINNPAVNQCLDARASKNDGYRFRKDTLNEGQVLVLDIKVRGATGNKFIEDNRDGCHLTCGLHYRNEAELRDVLGEALFSEFCPDGQFDMQKNGELLNLFLKKLVPEYYQAVVG